MLQNAKYQKNSAKVFNDCVVFFLCWNKLNELCFVCVVCVYFVVSKTMSSLRKDSTFTTGRTALYLSAVSTVVRSVLLTFDVMCQS